MAWIQGTLTSQSLHWTTSQIGQKSLVGPYIFRVFYGLFIPRDKASIEASLL